VTATAVTGDLVALLRSRRSSRAISARPVDDDVVTRIVTAAATAPSWCNVQAWRVYLVRSPEIADLSGELLAAADNRESCPDLPFIGGFGEPYRERKRTTDALLREARTGSSRLDPRTELAMVRKNWEFFGAGQAFFLTVPTAHLPYALVDLGCFLQTLLLAAGAEGLVACPQGALAQFPHVLRRRLPISTDEAVVCGVSFGHPDEAGPPDVRTPRAPLDQILWRRAEGDADEVR